MPISKSEFEKLNEPKPEKYINNITRQIKKEINKRKAEMEKSEKRLKDLLFTCFDLQDQITRLWKERKYLLIVILLLTLGLTFNTIILLIRGGIK